MFLKGLSGQPVGAKCKARARANAKSIDNGGVQVPDYGGGGDQRVGLCLSNLGDYFFFCILSTRTLVSSPESAI